MTDVDPVLVEIVEGTLASVEAEVEDQIGRTSRSPMIRDQHDFRAGIHDRRLRKLTGRSYSALVHPVVRDFPLETMRPGDIYFHNDVYLSEGGIGHLPDLCVTVPVFHEGEVVAFVQAFGHHDDIGGAVPGSMPSRATSVFEEGLMVPPVKLHDAGVPNEGVIRILTRNSRMPDSIAGDLDAECSACLMGARRLADLFARYGRDQVEACFDAIVSSCAETFRRELLAKIPAGTWTWEDYAEHDGVDEPRLHTQRIKLTKTADRLVLDLTGTSPQAKGPINHAGNYADGNFLKKWLAPILRNLADTPERMAQLDVNEGVVELIDIRFPPPGTLVTPVFPAPTNARTFVILRLLGILAGVIAKAVDGYMPADQETIRYTGISGYDAAGRWYLNREILGGGSGGRWYADGSDTIHVVPESRNLPVEFVETRFPVRVEALGLATDSGGAGTFRGGLGYRKEIRVLEDASYMSVADRSILSCWGVRGGKAGTPFRVTIDPDGPAERTMPGLCDWEPVTAGEVIRIETTGGGGWGDPLEREPWRVALDVRQRKVTPTAAHDDYGVVFLAPAPAPADAGSGPGPASAAVAGPARAPAFDASPRSGTGAYADVGSSPGAAGPAQVGGVGAGAGPGSAGGPGVGGASASGPDAAGPASDVGASAGDPGPDVGVGRGSGAELVPDAGRSEPDVGVSTGGDAPLGPGAAGAAPDRGVGAGRWSDAEAGLDAGADGDEEVEELVVDEAATAARRAELAAARGTLALFDRGPGYARLSGGNTHAAVDLD